MDAIRKKMQSMNMEKENQIDKYEQLKAKREEVEEEIASAKTRISELEAELEEVKKLNQPS